MCLSSVYKLRQGRKELVQSEVARMEKQGDGYVLYGILGEQGSVRGRVANVDFLDTHEVVIEEEPGTEARDGLASRSVPDPHGSGTDRAPGMAGPINPRSE